MACEKEILTAPRPAGPCEKKILTAPRLAGPCEKRILTAPLAGWGGACSDILAFYCISRLPAHAKNPYAGHANQCFR